MKPHVSEPTDARRESAGNAPRDGKRDESAYSSPQLFELGRANDLTRGGIKDMKKDSWNEKGFYV
jgi:hypothetical protein